MASAIEMKGITKTFPGVIANDKVNFILKKGEVHGLLGENGAGKTVLMSILYGLYQPDEGEIFVNGNKVKIDCPSTAMKLGIGMVHQNFMIVPSLTVAENIVLGREPTKHHFWFDIDKAVNEVQTLSKSYGLEIDPKAIVHSLSVGVRQRVEILKALFRRADVLILDEPTSVLTPQETEGLFRAIRALKQQGKSVVFISHKLREVCTICERITVLKRGKVVGTVDRNETNPDELARMMVGREVRYASQKEHAAPGSIVLQVKGLRAFNDRKLLALNDVTFEIHAFEILGIAGVEGNGQTELVEVLIGTRKLEAGEISLKGKSITNLSTYERIKNGLSCVPEDRQTKGLILDFTVSENLILGRHDRPPFASTWFRLNLEQISNFAEKIIQEYAIKA
ncbi:MAG: ABC transporter ATP-binding protein, partial [Candidatus Bathyarchaeia archaeon]